MLHSFFYFIMCLKHVIETNTKARSQIEDGTGIADDKADYMAKFPVILYFNNVIAAQMTKEGFFAEE